MTVAVRVLGPAWATADRVELYANGVKVREAAIEDKGKAGVKWAGEWVLPRPAHDIHLVAVATGPGVEALHWPVAKPYQPAAPVVRKRVIGVTGAVWLDADGDGRRTSALGYAQKVMADAGDGLAEGGPGAGRVRRGGGRPGAPGCSGPRDTRPVTRTCGTRRRAAGEPVLRGFDAYAAAWRDSQVAGRR